MAGLAGAGPFTPGNVVVVRTGQAPDGGLAAVSLAEFPPDGGAEVNAVDLGPFSEGEDHFGGVALPVSDHPMGLLSLSPSGRYLVLGGLEAQAKPDSSSPTENPGGRAARTVVRVDGQGRVGAIARLTAEDSGELPSSATSDDMRDICYVAGSGSGPAGGVHDVRYTTAMHASRQIVEGRMRQVSIAEDRSGHQFLVVSSRSRVFNVGALPLQGGESPEAFQFTTGFIGGAGVFALVDRDPGTGAVGLGGLDTLYFGAESDLQKFEWSAEGWVWRGSAAYVTISAVAVRERLGKTEIYVTAQGAGSSLLAKLIDDTPFGAAWHRLPKDFTVLASSGEARFHGVAFAPETLDLADLSLDGGNLKLEPEFDSDVSHFRAFTGAESVTVSAVAVLPEAAVERQVNGTGFGPLEDKPVSLLPGENILEVRVRSATSPATRSYSVRVERIAPPTLAPPPAPRIAGTTATVTVEVVEDGGGEILERGIVYELSRPEADPALTGLRVKAPGASGTGLFSVELPGLEGGKAYVFRGYAVNGAGISYSPAAVFHTEAFLFARLGGQSGEGERGISPFGIAVSRDGDVFFADAYSHTIRKITASGEVVLLAGKPGSPGSSNGVGEEARFYSPNGLVLADDGSLYVADTYNHAIRKIAPGGIVTTHAGELGRAGSQDGPAEEARFSFPKGVIADSAGNLFVADTHNHTIRLIGPTGEVITVAGKPKTSGSADGPGTEARFEYPLALAMDRAGALYVADSGNRTVRKIDADGTVRTLAGAAKAYGKIDAKGGAARFANLQGIAVDESGTIYVADTNSQSIRMIASDGLVSTLDCQPAVREKGRPVGFYPHSIATDRSGAVYVSDPASKCVRKIYRGVPTP